MNAGSRKFPTHPCNCGVEVISARRSDGRKIKLEPNPAVYMLIQMSASDDVLASSQPRAKLIDKTTLAGYMAQHRCSLTKR